MIIGNASVTMRYNTCRLVEIAICSLLARLQVTEQTAFQEIIALGALRNNVSYG